MTSRWMCAVAVSLSLLVLVPAFGGSQLATYDNARFGYSIAYPADLLAAQPESDNGDGRAFVSKVGTARVLVYAGYNVLQAPPVAIANEAEKGCIDHHAQYRLVKPDVVAISCQTVHGILYQKTMIRGDVLTTLLAAYLVDERARWDPVVAEMSRSMQAAKP